MTSSDQPIYLDFNATTPVAPEVAQAMIPYLTEHFGNPSSPHWFGIETRDAIDLARGQLAKLINCSDEELIFTGSATESNNLAILGSITNSDLSDSHVITSAIEHPAVLEVCHYVKSCGATLTILPVDSMGRVDPDDVSRAIRSNTRIISIMHANNESGTLQPIREIGLIARNHGILFHVDAAQSTGKIPVDVKDLNADLTSIAGHKFYGPKGIGALYIRDPKRLNRVIHGAGHERGLRPGTENVHNIVGIGVAADLARAELCSPPSRLMRDKLFNKLNNELDGIRWHVDPEHCLPNTLSIGFEDLLASDLMNRMPMLAISAGAACHAPGQVDVSHVLKAMKIPDKFAHGTLRISTGRMTDSYDIEFAAQMIIDSVRDLRK